MTRLPHFRSNLKYPQYLTTGFVKVSRSQVLGAGITPERFETILLRQDPGAKVQVRKLSPREAREFKSHKWRTIRGRKLAPKQLEAALRIGAVIAIGPNVRTLLRKAEKISGMLHKTELMAVFLDFV